MWHGRKKTERPKVVFNSDHIWRELVPSPIRPLSDEEMEWVRQSLNSRTEFVDFTIPQLFATSKCPCGTCRTVGLQPTKLPNADGVSGYLVEMEVIWYNFPDPFPESWEEIDRIIDPRH